MNDKLQTSEELQEKYISNDLKNSIDFYMSFLKSKDLKMIYNLSKSLAENYSTSYNEFINK